MNIRTILRRVGWTLMFPLVSFPAWAEGSTNVIRVFAEPVFPGVDWACETNALSPETVREVDAFVHTLDTTALVVVQHGRVAYQSGDVRRLSYLASSRKSILSMLYGANVAGGKIHLDATLKDLGLSDLGGLLPSEEQAKVIDLITARSGVYHPAANAGDASAFAPNRGSKRPGTFWLYNNWDFNAAGAAFERMTGRNLYDALRDDLAVPIGMQDFDRLRQQASGDLTRSQYSAYHLVLSTRDMARLGLLMLRQGQWRGRQIIPAEWVRRSTSVRTPLAEARTEPFGYGCLWWVWDAPFATGPYRGAYTSMGAYGQYITVLPALDLTIAHKTWPAGDVDFREYLRLLDLLTGRQSASPTELARWERAPQRYDLYLGQYRLAHHNTLEKKSVAAAVGIRRSGNRLLMDAGYPNGIRQLRLNPEPRTNAFVTLDGASVLFYLDTAGKAIRLTVRFDHTNELAYDKFSDQPPTAPAFEQSALSIKLNSQILDGYVGHYSAAPAAKVPQTEAMTFKREGDVLIGQKFAGTQPRRFGEAYFPESETNFFNTTEDEELTFLKNEQGEVTGVIRRLTGLFGEFGQQEYRADR